MKIFLSFFITLLFYSNCFANGRYKIDISINNLGDSTVYLANYYGSKIMVADSAKLNKQGKGTFEGDKELAQGLYIIYLDKERNFELLVGKDQEFSIDAGFGKGDKKVFSGAAETESFQKYQNFLPKQKILQGNLQKRYKTSSSNPDSVKVIREQMRELNNGMERYWKEETAKYSGTFYGDFMNSMIVPRVGEIEIPANCKNPDSLRWVKNYIFRKDHFWDNFNFAQSGLLRTPLIEKRVETYLKKILIQIPDSILHPAIQLIEKSKANDEMFRYIAGNLLTHSANSEIMGMDRVFVEIANNFFLNGQATWTDSATIEKIRRKVYLSLPNLIGNSAPELKLPDENSQYHSLHQVNAEYTVLYFWEPNCNHCSKSTPKLYNDVYLPLRDKGVEVFAVCTQDNKEEWQNFILDNKLFEWINVWDPEMISNFRAWYDVHSTPTLYLLDKDKKIIAKRIDVETTGKFIKNKLKSNH